MIPAEAVEAAAKGLFALEYAVRSPAARWSLMGAETRARYCEMARAALEAAAPYMQAEFEKRWKYDALDSINGLGSDTTQFQRKTPHGDD